MKKVVFASNYLEFKEIVLLCVSKVKFLWIIWALLCTKNQVISMVGFLNNVDLNNKQKLILSAVKWNREHEAFIYII